MILRTLSDYRDGYPHAGCLRSAIHSKNYRYGQEPYFQESLLDLKTVFGETVADCARFTFVIFKPDAFVCRSVENTIAELRRRGFRPIATETFRFDRYKVRELWRYEYNVARVERYRLIDDLLCSGPSLLVALESGDPSVDASVQLSDQKGDSDIRKRRTDSLRSAVGARTGTLNFIHTPDELIDLVREIGVLFDQPCRLDLYARMRERSGLDIGCCAAALAREYPSHSLTIDEVFARHGQVFERDVRAREAVLAEDPYKLHAYFRQTYDLGLWDWITLLNENLQFSHPHMLRTFAFEIVE